ncbi:MAG: PQQ-like beta-propeller repeat protein [Candidatus Eremiobacteraeota bacterium]|nr:PQQ-like beta-propeller repeat protein [Candidatus Eremiobacteraeota bacterium]
MKRYELALTLLLSSGLAACSGGMQSASPLPQSGSQLQLSGLSALDSALVLRSQTDNAKSASWAETYFNAAHTGFNPAEKTLSASNVNGLKELWGYDTPGTNILAFAVDKGNVFVLRGDYSIDAVSGTTHQKIWSVANLGASVNQPTLATAYGLVFVPCADTNDNGAGICALSETSGTLVWKVAHGYSCGGSALADPYVYDSGVIYAPWGQCGFHGMFAINAKTGQTIWGYNGYYAAGQGSAPAVGKGLVYYNCSFSSNNDAGVCALNQSTGALVWSVAYPQSCQPCEVTPAFTYNKGVLYEHMIFWDSSTGQVIALNATSGNQIWQGPVEQGYQGPSWPVAFAAGALYDSGTDDVLYRLNAKNGKAVWSQSFRTNGSPPSVANGVVYHNGGAPVSGGNAFLTAYDATSGKVLWADTQDNNGTVNPPPVVLNGTVYGASANGSCQLCVYGLPSHDRWRGAAVSASKH